MDLPNPKRPCHSHSVTSSIENSCSVPSTLGFNQSSIYMTISSFLSLSDLPMLSSPLSIGCSFDRVLDKVIHSATGTSHDEEDCFLDRTLHLAALLEKSTKRCIRKLATLQNSISWPLLTELTTKVFSMLDTKSLMQASACCTMFNKCAMDPICYSHIDLTTAAEHVDNRVVCIMIRRAGKELRSLKLGSISLPAGSTSLLTRSTSLLTRSCLIPLTSSHGFSGYLLYTNPVFTPDFLNTINISGLPMHTLRLKIGAPIMLLRNLDSKGGLCNGTRLRITQMTDSVLEAIVITGDRIGDKVCIPQIIITPSDAKLPFKMRRRQFPVSLAFAMTINKSQGQSLNEVGLYLPNPVFSHGQLYVALSRVTSKKGLRVLILDKEGKPQKRTMNVVFKEVFQNLEKKD